MLGRILDFVTGDQIWSSRGVQVHVPPPKKKQKTKNKQTNMLKPGMLEKPFSGDILKNLSMNQ